MRSSDKGQILGSHSGRSPLREKKSSNDGQISRARQSPLIRGRFLRPTLAKSPAHDRRTFQLPGELEKESKAKKGITELILLHICTNIDYKGSLISNILCATPSNSMEGVLSQPHAAWPTSLADLIRQTLLMTKEQDPLSIWSKYLSLQMVHETLAAHMLSGNFVTDRVDTLNSKFHWSFNLSSSEECMHSQTGAYQGHDNQHQEEHGCTQRAQVQGKTLHCLYWQDDVHFRFLDPLYQNWLHHHGHHYRWQPFTHPPSVLDGIHQNPSEKDWKEIFKGLQILPYEVPL